MGAAVVTHLPVVKGLTSHILATGGGWGSRSAPFGCEGMCGVQPLCLKSLLLACVSQPCLF